jgi:hypothetical protein
MSEELVSTFEYRGSRVVSSADLYGRNLNFLDRVSLSFYLLDCILCNHNLERLLVTNLERKNSYEHSE